VDELKEFILYDKVRYWIADMLDGTKEAIDRLARPFEAVGVSYFMSPYYFNELEAEFLSNFSVPGSGFILKDFLNYLAMDTDNVCTSHNFPPKLMRAFNIETNFHEDPSFKNKREVWMKEPEAIWRGSPRRLWDYFK
jgi:hypothetical protein